MKYSLLTRNYKLTATLFAAVLLLSWCGGCTQTGVSQTTDAQSDPFITDHVVEVRIVMPEETWQQTVDNALAEEYVKADFWYDAELIKDVAIRPKGNSSLRTTARSGSNRIGLKVDFNFFNSARNLDGIKKVSFNNGFSDPTFIREVLGYKLFEAMDVPTPRSSFVDLWVNNTHLGLYTMVEQVDKTFLTRNFDNNNGNLYKPEMPAGYLSWTKEDLADQQTGTDNDQDINLGGGNLSEIMDALQSPETEEESGSKDALPIRPPGFRDPGGMMGPGGRGENRGNLLEQMSLKTNENKPDHTLLYRFLDVLNNEPDETFPQEIEKVLDVDETLRFLAVSALIVHLDNYTGMGHNYYLYDDNGKFVVIPWDLNMAFGTFNCSLGYDGLVNFYIDEPTPGEVAQRPLVERLLAHQPYLEQYHSYLEELLDGPFAIEQMNSRIDGLAKMIRPYVIADELKFFTNAQFEAGLEKTGSQGSGFSSAPGLKPFIADRYISVSEQLAGTRKSSSGDGSGNGGTFGPGGRNPAWGGPGQMPDINRPPRNNERPGVSE